MAKGDDIVTRKKNKANRKKQQNKGDSSKVSSRVASIIAARKRRKSGKRRKCQGMCFSLPTPDDPFNDRQGQADFEGSETKAKRDFVKNTKKLEKSSSEARKNNFGCNDTKIDYSEQKNKKLTRVAHEQENALVSIGNLGQKRPAYRRGKIVLEERKNAVQDEQGDVFENLEFPSKFLILCLKSIEDTLRHDGIYSSKEDMPLFVDTWGNMFWNCFSLRKDIMDSGGASSRMEQIAWIASAAADSIASKEKEGVFFTSPFLLFLVPSKEKATEVRLVCKPLKALGIHSVSLHSGAPLDHQVNGLKSCEPEFIVSTPERLLELVTLDALDISRVSMLVVDGLEGHFKAGYLDIIRSIRQSISGSPYTVIFNDYFSHASLPVVRDLLTGSVFRLSLNNSVGSRSACVVQSVNVCSSEKEKFLKGFEILEQAYGNKLHSQQLKALFIVKKENKLNKLVTLLRIKGYSVAAGLISDGLEFENSMDIDSAVRPTVAIISEEEICTISLGKYEFIILPDFVYSIDSYIKILTGMARHSVNGVLQSFLANENASLAEQLIEILEHCGQLVPEALRQLSCISLL